MNGQTVCEIQRTNLRRVNRRSNPRLLLGFEWRYTRAEWGFRGLPLLVRSPFTGSIHIPRPVSEFEITSANEPPRPSSSSQQCFSPSYSIPFDGIPVWDEIKFSIVRSPSPSPLSNEILFPFLPFEISANEKLRNNICSRVNHSKILRKRWLIDEHWKVIVLELLPFKGFIL